MNYNLQNTGVNEHAALFIQRIKNATSDQHILLESNQLLCALMKQDVSIHQYYCYLVLMKQINDTYDKFIIKQIQPVFPELNRRTSSFLIEEDLQTINYLIPGNFTVKNYSLPTNLINTPYSLGFMYVMEGSRLGGKVISKHIQRVLGFNAEWGAKYISDTGFNTGLLWKEFLSTFSEYITNNSFEDEALSGASDAFSSIFKYFESNQQLYAI